MVISLVTQIPYTTSLEDVNSSAYISAFAGILDLFSNIFNDKEINAIWKSTTVNFSENPNTDQNNLQPTANAKLTAVFSQHVSDSEDLTALSSSFSSAISNGASNMSGIYSQSLTLLEVSTTASQANTTAPPITTAALAPHALVQLKVLMAKISDIIDSNLADAQFEKSVKWANRLIKKLLVQAPVWWERADCENKFNFLPVNIRLGNNINL